MSNTGANVASNGLNSYDPDGAIDSDYWIQKTWVSVSLFELKKVEINFL